MKTSEEQVSVMREFGSHADVARRSRALRIDVTLAMLSMQLRLPRDAAFGLFSIARSVGLLAHCIEQLRVGNGIRPRNRHTGPTLDERLLRPQADAAERRRDREEPGVQDRGLTAAGR